jgi:peptidoglycan/xylan/chitin deacetylase (PgdA/CDA1 family)
MEMLIGVLLLLVHSATPEQPARRMAITIDDLPGVTNTPDLRTFREMNRRMLSALRHARVPAIGFVNEKALHVEGERDARAGILRGWLDAGMTLGNHTFAHKALSKTPLAAYQDDVIRGEVITRQLLEARGLPLVYFRHPRTQTGPTTEIKHAFERFLTERGYRIAPFTIENSDWAYAALYEEALASRDEQGARALRQAYLEHLDRACAFFEKTSREMFERDIPQILLTHVNRLNADVFPTLLTQLRGRGYRFVSLDEVLADEAYTTPDLYVGNNGPSWFHRWSVAKQQPSRLKDEPDMPPHLWTRLQELNSKTAKPAPTPTVPAHAP